MCVVREVLDVIGSLDADLALVLHLDPGSVGKVNVSCEVRYLYRVAGIIRANRNSGLLINLRPLSSS